ncbi:SDR family oxidoreductase [Rothia nasimurium]|uniref:SDR family oxidoreductase n=1 Tax=Luteibacter anthropi TaxID=564369 RepID=A0A7X5U742_9GAMM|nr:SDR family oxidoreductase [Luteibacter anthropi]NII05072.1 SDR family oxidoreductase [Luteibacter anthropi]
MFSFSSQDVLVVGGSSGIGLATARAFAEAGARVTIASRSPGKLDAAVKDIGHDARAVVLDTADALAVEALLSTHTWHHVVVSAAKTPSGPVRQLSLDDAYKAMESKFWGAYRVARAARIHDGGSLTLVSGYLATRPSGGAVLQGAINAALEGLVRGMALEFSPVRVNAVSPGTIRTPLWDGMDDDKREAMFASVAGKVPARRVGEPEDVARAVLYAAATPFTTGSTIIVDGGASIG